MSAASRTDRSGEQNNRGDDTECVSIGDAARLLGVSIRTVRRWEAEGRVQAVRTSGGHRRFRIDALTRLHQARQQPDEDTRGPQLRAAMLPDKSLPVLERLLAARTDAVMARTARHMYSEHHPGWFRSAAALPHLKAFAAQLGRAARTGDWEIAVSGTSVLLVRAAGAEGGPSYQEAFLFLRTLRAVLVHELRAQDPSAPIALARLFDGIENEAARSAERFFARNGEARPATNPGDGVMPGPETDGEAAPASIRIPSRALSAARQACEALASMPACAGAMVLAGAPDSKRLEIAGSAGIELSEEPILTLANDGLSDALLGGTAAFVRSTSAVSRLPIAATEVRCLPIVASAELPGHLRVGTIVLVKSGADIESSMLGPLADLNGRLAALFSGSAGDADTQRDVERVGTHLA